MYPRIFDETLITNIRSLDRYLNIISQEVCKIVDDIRIRQI